MKSPYIAFSLEPAAPGRLTVSNMGPYRLAPNEPLVNSFSLSLLDERGVDATVEVIGKYVLMMLNAWHPEAFKPFPRLVIPMPAAQPPAPADADDAD